MPGRVIFDTRCERIADREEDVDVVVKAATWHDVEVGRKGEGWKGIVYLDL